MDSAHPKAPLRQGRVRVRRGLRVVEENLPGSFKLACVSYPHHVRSLHSPRFDGRYLGGRFDSSIPSCCTVEVILDNTPKPTGYRRRLGKNISHTVPRILVNPQVAPHGVFLPPIP